MAQTPKVFTPATVLSASVAVMYTQPVNSLGQVLRATVYNTDTVARQITVYRVTSGGSPGTTNIILSGAGGRVMPGQELIINALAGMVLNPGDTIQALADVTSVVNFFMSGYEST